MIDADIVYVKRILKAGLIKSPCLEIGAGIAGYNVQGIIEGAGIRYCGSDRGPSPAVTFIADFEDSGAVDAVFGQQRFGTVIVMNVLEHVFNPLVVLDNVMRLLIPGGTCVIVVPSVWPIHRYPEDYWRFNPDFFRTYAFRSNVTLMEEYFQFMTDGKCFSIQQSGALFPKPWQGSMRALWSRVIHRVFHTYGRGMMFACHITVGAVFIKKEAVA
ncbi:MAG TPA: methyltransferase domain-containing protein [Candidatus Omnitrophota bacterium]|nr:methyltransferase domain-containing protein [Candidatus Omnitrophota bacterium]HPT06744.1 methyltransferase domain-containing protein [Candidatus Omnitrophota bacterium]